MPACSTMPRNNYTNWSCHRHVASVRARVAVPVAVSWAGQLRPPKILRIRSLVRTWQSMPMAKGTVRASVRPLGLCCLPQGFALLNSCLSSRYKHLYVSLYLYCIWFILFGIYFLRSCESQKLYMQIRIRIGICQAYAGEMYLLCGAYLR